jgi:hypothetical protein
MKKTLDTRFGVFSTCRNSAGSTDRIVRHKARRPAASWHAVNAQWTPVGRLQHLQGGKTKQPAEAQAA